MSFASVSAAIYYSLLVAASVGTLTLQIAARHGLVGWVFGELQKSTAY